MDYIDDYIFEGLHLLVAEDGSVETPAGKPFLQLVKGRFWVNNHAHVLTGASEVETTYLYYALATVAIRPFVSGSVQAKLSQANLSRIPVPYPRDPVARKRIVSALGGLDARIQSERATSRSLLDAMRAIFRAWFVDFEPVKAKAAAQAVSLTPSLANDFPDSFTSTDLGHIPSGWSTETVGALADVSGGSTPSTRQPSFWEDGSHYWATPRDLASLTMPVLLQTDRRVTESGLAQISSGLLPPGTVLMSSRAPIGYLAVAEVPVAVNQGFIAMKAKPNVSNLFLLLWADSAQEAIVSRANGSTFLEISKSNFRPIPVVTPSADVMVAFDRLVRPLYERIVVSQRLAGTLAPNW
jgi:type I restriction enzyme S subunit